MQSNNSVIIDFDNYADYPAGTTVVFNWGAYYPTVEGVITGSEIVPANQWCEAHVRLLAEYDDLESGKKATNTIRRFDKNGVGVSVLEIADAPETKTKVSPWR